ncbi:hypothetical protein Krac_2974 [Ktedonobacter racemifer DSM 44963]|uniref:Uncharacterized protein n=1 Tax=Ktedonobacter racemifer DSM 44963 TaxID=485913 RepID=D6U047_KTERA|nr:hypothetical protein Krac_2974 [Ktedonobacter racemifer DSM 44963]
MGTRNAKKLFKKLQEIGEPCARKRASTVRRGEVGKGLSGDTTCNDTGRSKEDSSASPAPYPTIKLVVFPTIILVGKRYQAPYPPG